MVLSAQTKKRNIQKNVSVNVSVANTLRRAPFYWASFLLFVSTFLACVYFSATKASTAIWSARQFSAHYVLETKRVK